MSHGPNNVRKERITAGLPIYDPLRKVRPSPPGPVPTIQQLMRCHGGWCWAYCLGGAERDYCYHERPIVFAPFAIMWGLEASSDLIRKRLVCSQCGHKGVHLIMPSRDGLGIGMDFPEDWVAPTQSRP